MVIGDHGWCICPCYGHIQNAQLKSSLGDVRLIPTVSNCSVSDCHSNATPAVLFCTGETGILIIQGPPKRMSDSKFNLKFVTDD